MKGGLAKAKAAVAKWERGLLPGKRCSGDADVCESGLDAVVISTVVAKGRVARAVKQAGGTHRRIAG